jgi:predicted nucleotidyltransferase
MSDLGQRIAAVLAPMEGIRVAWFFGSRSKGNHRPDSDLDLLVVFDHALDGSAREKLRRQMVYELAGALDSIGESADVADAREADSAVAFGAVAEGEVVVERTKRERVAAQVYVWRRYEDDGPRRDLFRRAALTAVERMKHDQR